MYVRTVYPTVLSHIQLIKIIRRLFVQLIKIKSTARTLHLSPDLSDPGKRTTLVSNTCQRDFKRPVLLNDYSMPSDLKA